MDIASKFESTFEDIKDKLTSDHCNISDTQRIASIAAGALLLISALKDLKKPSVGTAIKAISGGAALYRGVSGYCPVTEAVEDHK